MSSAGSASAAGDNRRQRVAIVITTTCDVLRSIAAQFLTNSSRALMDTCMYTVTTIAIEWSKSSDRRPHRPRTCNLALIIQFVCSQFSVCLYTLCVLTLISKLGTSCSINCLYLYESVMLSTVGYPVCTECICQRIALIPYGCDYCHFSSACLTALW